MVFARIPYAWSNANWKSDFGNGRPEGNCSGGHGLRTEAWPTDALTIGDLLAKEMDAHRLCAEDAEVARMQPAAVEKFNGLSPPSLAFSTTCAGDLDLFFGHSCPLTPPGPRSRSSHPFMFLCLSLHRFQSSAYEGSRTLHLLVKNLAT